MDNLDIFTNYEDAHDLISNQLAFWKQQKSSLDQVVYKSLDRINMYPRLEREFARVTYIAMSDDYAAWTKSCSEIKKYQRLDYLSKVKFGKLVPDARHDYSEQIRIARETPITEVISQYAQVVRGMVKCPIHQEKTASLKVYPNTNSWYCFGCHKGGSTIDFVMYINNLEFNDAVKLLTQGA